ncbi:MAG: hypothetical protein J7K95_05385 [Thermoplasmata archaeon]|nr:hypothetical protein [Thermoplasmata archaeon]
MNKEEIKNKKEINEEEVEEIITIGNIIIEIIDILDEEYAKLREQDNKREKELLGITLSECNTIEEINKYEEILNKNAEIIDNDKVFREINERQQFINKIRWRFFEMLKMLLADIYSEYKDISTDWIWIKYKDIRRIFKEAIGENGAGGNPAIASQRAK